MRLIRFIILMAFVLLSACHQKNTLQNFLYDMGPNHFPVEQGFLRVNVSLHYDSLRGYGWLRSPLSEFDTANSKLYSQALRSGVLGMDSLVFRADVPAGDYYVTVQMGNAGKDTVPMKMQVFFNNEVLPDTVVLPWYRLNYKTIRHRITLKDKRIDIKVKGIGTRVGLQAVEIRPVASWQDITQRNSIEEDTSLIQNFRSQLMDAVKKDPADINRINQLEIVDKYLLACYYYDGGGWLWAVKKTGLSLIYRMYAAADLLEPILVDETDPLYDRAMYLLARVYYWLDKEDENHLHRQRAKELFGQLQKKYKDNPMLRMYLDEQLPHDIGNIAVKNNGAPLWAIYQREAMHRMQELIHWWVRQRQAPNGELGGKYGDDVEMLRWWMPAILGTDDSLAQVGYTRLADGVWNSEVLDRGFSKRIDDVEHSSELFRDTHSGIFLIKYGDPEYVERCITGMQHFRDVWTGVTSLGHRHFKSYYLSSTEVNAAYPYGVDVALNARALLPGLWTAWYNKNPHLIQLFTEWSNAWLADAARSGNGKPAGVMPSAVAFEGDRIGGNSKEWYAPQLTYDYYDWDHLGHVNELLYHLLGMYKITGDQTFLQTIDVYNHLIQSARQQPSSLKSAQPGSLAWVQLQLLEGGQDWELQHPMGRLFAMAQQLTRRYEYDSLIKEYGAPYNRYLISHDTTLVINGLKQILQTLRFNFPLLTSEVKFTDRVYVPGSNLLTGMYTGHFGAGYEFPALAVSWKNTGPDVSVFVQRQTEKSFSALLYNFGHEKVIGMRTWQLEPGLYKIAVRTANDKDGTIDEKWSDTIVAFNERVNDFSIKIPAGKTTFLEVTQVKAFPKLPVLQPDLAIAARDIELVYLNGKLFLKVNVHNIGNKDAFNSSVVLSIDGEERSRKIISVLSAPNHLQPQTKLIHLPVGALFPGQVVTLRVHTNVQEITTLNNSVTGRTGTDAEKLGIYF